MFVLVNTSCVFLEAAAGVAPSDLMDSFKIFSNTRLTQQQCLHEGQEPWP